MMNRAKLDERRFPVGGHRQYPVAVALLTLLLVGGLAPAALAGPDGPQHPQLVATATPPGRTARDEPSRTLDTPVATAPVTGVAMAGGYVDPAGGHPLVRPIETRNPYHGR